MLRRLCGLLVCLPLFAAAPPVLPPAAPPSGDAKTWDARIRYRITAFDTERITQFREMMKELEAAGFKRTDEPAETEVDDPRATRLAGTLPDRSVDRVLRQRHVRSMLLLPKGVAIPEKDKRVRVELLIGDGYQPSVQRDLARQTVAVLNKDVAFVEGVGYDHRGFTRLVGSAAAESVAKLLEDPSSLPSVGTQPLFKKIGAFRLIIVRPDLPTPSPRPAVVAVPAEQVKFDPALRALLGDEGAAGKAGRLEVILGYTPKCDDKTWVGVVESSGAIVEGRTGPLVTVSGVTKDVAPKLAALEQVVVVRVPRLARVGGGPRAMVPTAWEPIRESGLAKLHALGQRGKGIRVAVVADDFAGWETLKGRKDGKTTLPDPVLVDLTAGRNPELVPDAYPSAGKGGLGWGSASAKALLRAAPEAQLTLIRVDAAAPWMLEEAARAINGEAMDRTVTVLRRGRELRDARDELDRRGEALAEERRVVYANLSDDEEPKKRREAYLDKQEAFDKERGTFNARENRYFKLIADVKKLRGVRIVASGLVWVDGFPVDGSSALSRYFDDKPFKAALWFQAAGDVRGQAWADLFRDEDANGVMEFAGENARLPRGAWTKELNFLSWQASDGIDAIDAPANACVRISLQWREPHDCLPLKVGEDVYREPLAQMRLILVRQHDPSGKTRPIDDLEIIAESATLPQRLNQTLNAATWEQVIELRLPKAGRYGVFVEGKLPESIQAKGEVRLPAQKRFGELRARLFVNTLEGDGRATWTSFPTQMGSLGMPADSGRAVTVGAADSKAKARATSAEGPPYNLSLSSKPDVLSFEDGGGTTEAAAFAAGLAASSPGTRAAFADEGERRSRKAGAVLRVGAKKE